MIYVPYGIFYGTIPVVLSCFRDLESDEIRQCSWKLAQTYPSDLQADELANEMAHFVEFAKTRGCNSLLPVPWPC